MAGGTTLVFFDYISLPDGSQQVLYLGKAPYGTGVSDDGWQIQKFSYTLEADSKYYVSQIQTLDGKNWTDRASYPWT